MHLHILGICGTFMAGLARLARAQGHDVSGADRSAYPPMSTQLEDMGIAIHRGYDAASLDVRPDLVLVGNALTRGMPVIERLLDERWPCLSGPAWLAQAVLGTRHVLAVAGTHGKTTTSAMLAWILDVCGEAPGFLIGGVPGNFEVSARLGEGRCFVIEADEYDTAFFDKRAKFVHYAPSTLVINNLEHDHADIYPDVEAIERQFHHLLRTIPARATIIAGAPDAHIDAVLAMGCWTPVQRFGPRAAHWSVQLLAPDATRLRVHRAGVAVAEVNWDCYGTHNARNALAAIAAAADVGIAPARSASALREFRPPARRQELLDTVAGVRIVLDFAHHPTAIAETLAALRAHAPGRVLAVLEPRSNTMRAGTHVEALCRALDAAAHTFVLSAATLDWDAASALAALGPRLSVQESVNALAAEVARQARAGDQVLVMSNGDSLRIGAALADALRLSAAQPAAPAPRSAPAPGAAGSPAGC